MSKEIIIKGKYRTQNNEQQRLKLIHYQHRENETPSRLELHQGNKLISTYSLKAYQNNPADEENPANPEDLRNNLKGLQRKLNDSKIFPPNFVEELTSALKQYGWHSAQTINS